MEAFNLNDICIDKTCHFLYNISMKTFPQNRNYRRNVMFMDRLDALSNRPYDILLLGEILLDETTNHHGGHFMTFGGSPANITVNLKQLGIRASLCAALGNDDVGNFLLKTLVEHDVSTTLIHRFVGPTTKVLLKQTTETPTPDFHRSSDHHIHFNETLYSQLLQTKVLHLSYWPLTKEPSLTTALKAIAIAKENNVLISFDPNIHAQLKTEETISDAALKILFKQVDIIKPSLDDSARLFGFGYDKEYYMNQYELLGIPLILMTLGKDGVFVSHHKQRFSMPTKAVDVLDATGAGDAFWSGFYGGLFKGLTLEESVLAGQLTSSITLKHIGAIAPLPTIEKIIHEVKSR